MKRLKILLAVMAAALVAAPVTAATVTVQDGDFVSYDPATSYVFDLALTQSDPTVTVGFGLEDSESIPFVLNAPTDSSLLAAVTTSAGAAGTTLINFDNTGNAFQMGAGTTEAFSLEAVFGATQWLTVSLSGQPGEAGLADGPVFAGSLFGEPAAYDGDGSLSFVTDADGSTVTYFDDTSTGGDGTMTAVPLPATGFLLFGGLGGLAALRRKKRKTA